MACMCYNGFTEGERMTVATIEIELDERTADVYTNASQNAREKLRVLLSIWLQEFEDETSDLGQLMDEISENAVSRGLTPEILESLLLDEG